MTIKQHIHFHLGKFLGKKYRRGYYEIEGNYLWGVIQFLYDFPEENSKIVTESSEGRLLIFESTIEDWIEFINQQDNNEKTNQTTQTR